MLRGIDMCWPQLKFKQLSKRMECALLALVGTEITAVGYLGFKTTEGGSDGNITAREQGTVRPTGSYASNGLNAQLQASVNGIYGLPALATQNQSSIAASNSAVTIKVQNFKEPILEEVVWMIAWRAMLYQAAKVPRREEYPGDFKYISSLFASIVISPRLGSLTYMAIIDGLAILPFAMVGENKFGECDFIIMVGGVEVADGVVKHQLALEQSLVS